MQQASAVLQRTHADGKFLRFIFRTPILQPGDDLLRLIEQKLMAALSPGDIIIISSRAVAACQGQLLPVSSIEIQGPATRLAKWWQRLRPTDLLAHPVTMQKAIDLVGLWPMVAATVWRACGFGNWRLLKVQPVVLLRLGEAADLPVYQGQLILPPRDAAEVAHSIWQATGYRVAVVSAGPQGRVRLVGASPGVNPRLLAGSLLDNPLGDGCQQTPLAILRQVWK
ncbi:MAG: hypothetical protein GX060_07625 [Firmicutes bacterium]|nr:hypothetical protein [Bacillota bacterium]